MFCHRCKPPQTEPGNKVVTFSETDAADLMRALVTAGRNGKQLAPVVMEAILPLMEAKVLTAVRLAQLTKTVYINDEPEREAYYEPDVIVARVVRGAR